MKLVNWTIGMTGAALGAAIGALVMGNRYLDQHEKLLSSRFWRLA